MCLVFKTTYIDRRKPLREGAFFFTRTMLFPPLDKRNTRDKAKGVRVSSERPIGELGMRCLSTLNSGRTLGNRLKIEKDSTKVCCAMRALCRNLRKCGDKEYVARGEPILVHPSLQIVLFGIIHLKAEFERSIDWHCPYP